MQIAMSPARQKYPLSTRKITKKTLTRALLWSVLFLPIEVLLIALSFAVKGRSDTAIQSTALIYAAVAWLCLYLVIVLLTYLYQRWYFATYYYDIQDHHVVIRKNPITPHEITLPFERIQDVYVDQDLWDRIFRLYDVHLSTATATSAMEAHIDGLLKEASDALRDELLKSVHAKLSRGPSQKNNG